LIKYCIYYTYGKDEIYLHAGKWPVLWNCYKHNGYIDNYKLNLLILFVSLIPLIGYTIRNVKDALDNMKAIDKHMFGWWIEIKNEIDGSIIM
jgi:hypothetical protein